MRDVVHLLHLFLIDLPDRTRLGGRLLRHWNRIHLEKRFRSPCPAVPAWMPSALRPGSSTGTEGRCQIDQLALSATQAPWSPPSGHTRWEFRLDFPYGSRVGFAHFSTSQVPPVTGGDSSDPLRGIQVLLLSLQPGRTSPHSPPGSVSPGGLFCFCESGRGSGGSKAWRGNSGGNVPLYVALYDAIASCGSSRRSDP